MMPLHWLVSGKSSINSPLICASRLMWQMNRPHRTHRINQIVIRRLKQFQRQDGFEADMQIIDLMFYGFNHGMWCVKNMARWTPVTTKPHGEARGFCADRSPKSHVFQTSRWAMIKLYYTTSKKVKRWQYSVKLYKNKVNGDGSRRQQSTTDQDWVWLFLRSDGTPNFCFWNNCFVDKISIHILK